jgi:superfamily II DNA or RNA helicase
MASEQGLAEHDSVLVSMATGTGKTWVFASVAHKAASNGWRVLVLAHRKELLDQARHCLATLNPRVPIGWVKGDERDWRSITVASVPSLGESRLGAMPPVHLLITDEAHHADAPSYQAIYEAARRAYPGVKHLGLTATPFRRHLEERGKAARLTSFDAHVFEYGLQRAVNDGWLSPIRALAPVVGLDLVGLQRDKITGDFASSAVEARVNLPEVHDKVGRSWFEACNRPAIAFCATIRHAKALAEHLRKRRVPASAIWSGMDHPSQMGKGARERIIQGFKDGAIKILTNVNILTEGFDAPNTVGAILLRPTGSLVEYAQMIGRTTRLASGKAEGLILDFTGTASALDLSAARLSDLAERAHPEAAAPGISKHEMYEVFRIERASA